MTIWHVRIACWITKGYTHMFKICRLRLKCDGTRWRTGGEVKGKEENGVGNQYASHDCRTQTRTSSTNPAGWCVQLACQQSTELNPADLNGLVLFTERRNLVSAHVPSHFKRSLILSGFPPQQWLHERASMLRYTYTACLVIAHVHSNVVTYRSGFFALEYVTMMHHSIVPH
jgi:hypothetical protein